MRTHYCGDVKAASVGQEITVAGWVHRRRDHGGVIFIDLRDREGLVQVVCDPDREAMFEVAEGVRNEFCLKIEGLVRLRPAVSWWSSPAAAPARRSRLCARRWGIPCRL